MCGKFTQLVAWEDALVFFSRLAEPTPEEAPVIFATPMRSARIIRLDEAGKRESVPMRWGFSKPGATSFKPDHMHARSETVDSRPTFAESFAERRGILMIDTFNEGEEQPNGKTRQWVIRPKDRKPVALAVIWKEWEGDAGAVPCFIQITVPANATISKITDRMPAVLQENDWPVWLGEEDAPLTDVKSLLRTFDDEGGWEMSEQASSNREKPKTKPQMDLF
ncbi:MAG TPA: SOS response-associated peptidase family protein [Hyphomonadaceae bacterium]|jgi:putative SOS response-associated peptidase YedK|nr:SOS response-associated peptidase family protein [Hyphomonadaceae bacterium]HPN04686.1 SOS response-associated peptidase family protein [Hyphomonadaceae bacterium]